VWSGVVPAEVVLYKSQVRRKAHELIGMQAISNSVDAGVKLEDCNCREGDHILIIVMMMHKT